MFVHSTAVLLKTPADTLNTLDAQVKQQTGIRFRRVNKFILLAICGAHQCAAGRILDPATAVWLTTENGTVGDTEKGLGQLFQQHIYPKPYNFINTMSNTAAFYIAQSLKLNSPNITMACKDAAFERGLSLARADLRCGAASGALIGGVDEAVFSETNLQSRFGDHLKDGSAWLLVSATREEAVGEIREIRYFADRQRTAAWLQALAFTADPVLACGIRITAEEQQNWQKLLPRATFFDYVADHGYFDSAPAAGVCFFFQLYKGRTCLHINKDIYGHYTLVLVKVY